MKDLSGQFVIHPRRNVGVIVNVRLPGLRNRARRALCRVLGHRLAEVDGHGDPVMFDYCRRCKEPHFVPLSRKADPFPRCLP